MGEESSSWSIDRMKLVGFLLRSVQDVGDKKYCLIFLKGKGLVGGWFLLAKKLRALGVSTLAMSKVFSGVPIFEKVGCSFKEKVKGTYADATRVKTGELGESLWLHFGDQELLCREEQLSRYLVGCFGNNSDSVPPLLSLKGREFQLQRWGPEVGCFWNGSHAKEVWVRIVGLPLHFWSREVFKRIGESYGGFVAMDEEFSQLQLARNLVRATGKDLLGSLQEAPPWVSQVVPWVKSCRSARQEVRDEFVGGSRAGGSMRESQPVDQNLGSKEKF
ncbi:hypothetical protein CK203_058389 [Vitis vinifera]|uniref:Uncharacterized protein n=1 Tax=Vitis vinifera TaxID=29760 RepID=A0A438GI36_VITVI|nr:hypothetical protein CK203_058389 [Vitis vinifera]